MKAILVIDMPKNCITCRYRFSKWNEEVGTFHICSVCDEKLREEDFGKNRADFCPLKPLPKEKHRDTRFDEIAGAIDYGWNSCLAALEGKNMVDKLIDTLDKILEKNNE